MAMNTYMTRAAACLLASCAFSTAAYAGGFARGEADTDILYEDGTYVARATAVYISPGRDYDTVGTSAGTDSSYTQDYWIPSVGAKFRFSPNFSCALTYTQPFGADTEYGTQAQAADKANDVASGFPYTLVGGNSVKSAKFDTDEYGGTCAVNFSAGMGQVYIIGGLFSESFDYTEVKDFGTLHLRDDSALGYRLGLGYTIEEYALRAELMYRSQVDHKADGSFTPGTPSSFLGYTLGTPVSATGEGSLPQSLELNLRSGVAPGWLVFGSVKWTDWSVLQTLDYNISGAFGDQTKDFFWKDGWTLTAGVGHKFNEKVSGAVSLTWDSGVGTGADIMTDTWTLGAGTQIEAGPGVLQLGAAVSYLTAGSQSVADGAAFDATADGDWAYALSASYKISF